MAASDDALLEQFRRAILVLSAGQRAAPWIVQAVRWGLSSIEEALQWQRLYKRADLALVELAPFADAAAARAMLVTCATDEHRLRAALLARLLALGERSFVATYLGEQDLDVQADLLAALQPEHPPSAVLGDAFAPLKDELVHEARERALGGWTSLLFAVLPLLDEGERTALVDWAVRDPKVLHGLRDEEVIPLARAGLGRRAVERACAVEDAYPRAIALAHIALIMTPLHPDREILARAQLALLKLPRSSQPYRSWRNQLFDAPVPASITDEARAVLDTWPPEERAIALLAWARHTPALRPEAFAALAALRPEAAALGALVHFEMLPEDARGAAFDRGRALARRWHTRGEQPFDNAAGLLFFETPTLDAAALWTLVARCAPDRAAARESLSLADLGRCADERSALVRIAIAAAETLPEGDLRRASMAGAADAALKVLSLEQRIGHLGHIGRELPEPARTRFVTLLHDTITERSPPDWLAGVLSSLEDLPPADRDGLFSHAVEEVLAREDEHRADALLLLAADAEPTQRYELLFMAFTELAAGPKVRSYPLFRALRPEDPWPLHERLAALLDHTVPGMDIAYLRSCLAASQPASRRGEMIEQALSAWEEQGLVKFDVAEIPTENLWPVIDHAGALRILHLCLARPDDEGTEECLSGLLGHLARLGEEPTALVCHLPLIAAPRLRVRALSDLAPGLSPAEVTRQIMAIIEAAATDDDHHFSDTLDAIALLRRVGAEDRALALDTMDRLLRAQEEPFRHASWDELLADLRAIGEGDRAEQWLSLAGCSGDAVGGHLALAALCALEDPRRAELVRRAEEISEALDLDEQRWLHADIQGREALVSPAWARRAVLRALSDEQMCIRDLMPWMPLARRAFGDEWMARLAARLAGRP